MSRIEKLKRQIAELEKKIASGGFRDLVEKNSRKRDEDRLKKLRKELDKLQMGK